MPYPKISIVTPSYNQARYLEWTMRSVVLQRYPNLEYIVMDGGSKDGSADVIRKYEAHLHHWQSAKDEGQSDAIRKGFLKSSGEIMAYLNSDDLLAPGTLHWVAEFFRRNPRVDAVYSHRCAVNETNDVIWHWYLPRHVSYLMKRWDLIPQETCFWRRRIYEETSGIDSSFQFAMDYDLFVKFMLRGKLHRTNRFLGAFRQHAQAKSSTNLETVGRTEISRVWGEHNITCHKWDSFVGSAFTRFVELRSYVFGRTNPKVEGMAPVIGSNYDAIWGRLLTNSSIPPK